jgi:hypothetical protein
MSCVREWRSPADDRGIIAKRHPGVESAQGIGRRVLRRLT